MSGESLRQQVVSKAKLVVVKIGSAILIDVESGEKRIKKNILNTLSGMQGRMLKK